MSIATWSHARDAAPPCGERVDAPAAVNAKPGECARLAIPTSREPRRGSHAMPLAVRRRAAVAAAAAGMLRRGRRRRGRSPPRIATRRPAECKAK
jgi:hypothetical protein